MSTWTGPWRVANDGKKHVYAVQNVVTAELRDVHVATTRFYTDDQLEITGALLKVSQQLENEGEYHIRSISAIKWAASATSSLSRWPGKDWRRRREPGNRCRACSMTRRPCCVKSSRRCGRRQSRSGRSCCGMGCVCYHIVIWGF